MKTIDTAIKTALMFILTPFVLLAQDYFNIEPIGNFFTHNFTSVKVIEDYAYCGSVSGLSVIDVFDKQNPVIITEYAVRGTNEPSITVVDTVLYFVCGFEGILIFSIANAEQPQLLSQWKCSHDCLKLEVRNNVGYLATRQVVATLDLSDPYNPQLLDSLVTSSFGVALYEDVLFSSSIPISVIDVSSPENIRIIDYANFGSTSEITIKNDILFAGLETFRILGDYDLDFLQNRFCGGLSRDNITFIGDFVCGMSGLANEENQFYIFEFEDPARLHIVGECPSSTYPVNKCLDYYNGFVYCAGGEKGISIFDVRDIDNPHEVTRFPSNEAAKFINISANGNYVYAFDEKGGFYSIDFTNVDFPDTSQVIRWNEFRNAHSNDQHCFWIQNDLLFLSGHYQYYDENNDLVWHYGVDIYSLESLACPELIGNIFYVGGNNNFIIENGYLYSQHINAVLNIVSIEDIQHPEIVFCDTIEGRSGGDIALEDNLLVTTRSYDLRWGWLFDGLVIWDVNNPCEPIEVARVSLHSFPRRIAVENRYVYYNNEHNNGFGIVDLNDLEHPRLVHWENPDGNLYVKDIVIHSGRLFIAHDINTVSVYSLDDPEMPELVGRCYTPDRLEDITVQDEQLFVAANNVISRYDISALRGLWYLAASDTEHNFDSVAVGESAYWELTLSNNSQISREISSIAIDSEEFMCDSHDPFMMAGNSNTTIAISFQPNNDGVFEGTLIITSDEQTLNITLRGRGYLANEIGEGSGLLDEFALFAPYPNPFNSTTTIGYSLPAAGNVSVAVYDLSGREVARLVDGEQLAGNHEIVWTADGIASGVYVVKLDAGGVVAREKVVLVK